MTAFAVQYIASVDLKPLVRFLATVTVLAILRAFSSQATAAAADTVPLTCGALSAGRLDAAGEVDLFSFVGESGQIISVALASTGGFTHLSSRAQP